MCYFIEKIFYRLRLNALVDINLLLSLNHNLKNIMTCIFHTEICRIEMIKILFAYSNSDYDSNLDVLYPKYWYVLHTGENSRFKHCHRHKKDPFTVCDKSPLN